jgi:hypothetical protein
LLVADREQRPVERLARVAREVVPHLAERVSQAFEGGLAVRFSVRMFT